MLINTLGGQVLQAKNLMSVKNQAGPTEIQRKNQERVIRVTAEPEGTLSEGIDAVKARLGEIRVPPDFNVGFGAEAEEQARAFAQLQMMLILRDRAGLRGHGVPVRVAARSVHHHVLGAARGDRRRARAEADRHLLSLQAYIGVIMLAGIVVSNAILLVDYTNILRRRDKMPLREAVETAGRVRLRPILMTSIATMLGLVPMSLGIGEGAELQAPLARVVIGGLLASTMITLVFVPTVYTLFEEGWKGLRTKHAE